MPTKIELGFNQGPALNPAVSKETFETINKANGPKQQIRPLFEVLRDASEKGLDPFKARPKPQHYEQFIVFDGKDLQIKTIGEIREILENAALGINIVGLHEIGNQFQTVKSMVHGINPEQSNSGFERPVTYEAPGINLAVFATQGKKLHIFRFVQLRQGKPVLDTPRDFTPEIKDDKQIENIADPVQKALKRVLNEETGDSLMAIKRIIFLGQPIANSTLIGSPSPFFAVQVDYKNFLKHYKVVDQKELQRRKEQFKHEGITGVMIDMTLEEYINYKKDIGIKHDLAADGSSDIVVIQSMATMVEKLENDRQRMANAIRSLRKLPAENPTEVHSSAYRNFREAWFNK